MFKTKILVIVGLLLVFSSVGFADDTKFIQVKRNKKNVPISLETATVTYEKTTGNKTTSVDLIGVVHIADSAYYRQLNEDLSEYDTLLYELVAEKGTVVKKNESRDSNILNVVQKLIGQFLGLEHQVSTEPNEGINYEQKNFVHADMSPKELQEEMAKNGDNRFTMILSVLLENMRKRNKEIHDGNGKQQEVENIDIMALLSDPEGPLKIKRMMAEQFDKMKGDELGEVLTGYLVDKRNANAIKVFDEQV